MDRTRSRERDTDPCRHCLGGSRIVVEPVPIGGFRARCLTCRATGPVAPKIEQAVLLWVLYETALDDPEDN